MLQRMPHIFFEILDDHFVLLSCHIYKSNVFPNRCNLLDKIWCYLNICFNFISYLI